MADETAQWTCGHEGDHHEPSCIWADPAATSPDSESVRFDAEPAEFADLTPLDQPIDCFMPCADPDIYTLHCEATACRFGPRRTPKDSGSKVQP